MREERVRSLLDNKYETVWWREPEIKKRRAASTSFILISFMTCLIFGAASGVSYLTSTNISARTEPSQDNEAPQPQTTQSPPELVAKVFN